MAILTSQFPHQSKQTMAITLKTPKTTGVCSGSRHGNPFPARIGVHPIQETTNQFPGKASTTLREIPMQTRQRANRITHRMRGAKQGRHQPGKMIRLHLKN
jgi:hypothetical protein